MSVVLDGSSDFLRTLNNRASPPCTIAAWMKSTASAGGTVAASDIKGTTGYKIHGGMDAFGIGTLPVRAWGYNGTTWAVASTTVAFSGDAWEHVCGVFAADNDRAVFLDGGNKGTTSIAVTGNADEFIVGVRRGDNPIGYFTGKIAHVAIWNTSLTSAQVAQLASGIAPTSVASANLTDYWALVSSPVATVGSFSLVEGGTPTWDSADHPSLTTPGTESMEAAVGCVGTLAGALVQQMTVEGTISCAAALQGQAVRRMWRRVTVEARGTI